MKAGFGIHYFINDDGGATLRIAGAIYRPFGDWHNKEMNTVSEYEDVSEFSAPGEVVDPYVTGEE